MQRERDLTVYYLDHGKRFVDQDCEKIVYLEKDDNFLAVNNYAV